MVYCYMKDEVFLMNEHKWIKPIKINDLKLYQYGYEKCQPNHSYGPAKRDHYLLHFITSGKGTFYCENKSYQLSAGHAFLICPEVITSYTADTADPWTYSWIGFNGLNTEYYLNYAGLNTQNPIFSYKNESELLNIISEFKAINENTIIGQTRMTGYLYMLLAFIMESASKLSVQGKAFFSSKEEYIKNAVDYIQSNYSRKISVDEVANYIGLNRSYFGAIFKEITEFSPRDFIIYYRMDKAKKLLSDISMNIGDVSRSVGYDDPLAFSKQFKKIVGVSPYAYRKSL